MNNPHPRFDIYAFDAERLNFPELLAIANGQAHPDWSRTLIQQTAQRTTYRLDPTAPDQFPSLTVKFFHDQPELAMRTLQIMIAIDEFGVSTAPYPFYADNQGVLICEWIHGEALTAPPAVGDEENWHRIMAVLNVAKNLPFGNYAQTIPMLGNGVQSPADVFTWIEAKLAQLGENHPLYVDFARLLATAQSKINPAWHMVPKIALSRLDPQPNHFIWDGAHLRGIGWSQSDWADVAFDVAQLTADPLYEEISASHWVWFRWEYARLSHDEGVVARATTYAQQLTLYWAIELTLQTDQCADVKEQHRLKAQRDRYRKKAQKLFS